MSLMTRLNVSGSFASSELPTLTTTRSERLILFRSISFSSRSAGISILLVVLVAGRGFFHATEEPEDLGRWPFEAVVHHGVLRHGGFELFRFVGRQAVETPAELELH